MAKPGRYTAGEFLRDFLPTVTHVATSVVAYVIAKEQPVIAGVVFVVGTVATRGVRKELQLRLLELGKEQLDALESRAKETKDD